MAFLVSDEFDPFGDLAKKRMALSVTRHALLSEDTTFNCLLCGVDSLDLGLWVNWGEQWPELLAYLQTNKDQAQEKKSVLDATPSKRQFLHLPTGKAPNFRFHLQFPDYHVYIGISATARNSPNVYVSLASTALWAMGVVDAVDQVILDLASLGGSVYRVVPSRLDLCADYQLSASPSLPFFKNHAVARSRAQSSFELAGVLETFYSGAPGAPVRLRIYDKSKEIKKSGKLWFGELWGIEEPENVWRIEYQMRRAPLKQFGINSIDDLTEKIGGLWSYLSENWFSLRLQDNDQQNRRSLLPWWADVQEQQKEFGPAIRLRRGMGPINPASASWLVCHISGCLASFAAKIGATDFLDAINQLNNEMHVYWFDKDFKGEVCKRSIKLAQTPNIDGGDDEEP